MKLKSHRGSCSNIYSQSCSSLAWSPGGEGELLWTREGDILSSLVGALRCLVGLFDVSPFPTGCCPWSDGWAGGLWQQRPGGAGGKKCHQAGCCESRGGRSLQLVGDGRTESKDLGGKGRKSCFPAGLGEKLSFIFLFNCKIPPWCFALQLVWASECGKLAWGVPLVTLLEMVFGFSFLRAT